VNRDRRGSDATSPLGAGSVARDVLPGRTPAESEVAPLPHGFVHLELYTPNLGRAAVFYEGMFGWVPESTRIGQDGYVSLATGEQIEAGVVERSDRSGPSWVPYVSVPNIAAATERASELGAAVTLAPREGPTGWRSKVEAPDSGPVALWQWKR
jgi:predicted enzyme related to lactoylglutathione lyase